jgi:lysozyme
MQTSARGIAALEHEEGVVLKAYRDAVGVWTIGAGLTAASGVVKPKAGMTISTALATNLLQAALRRNYEPSVSAAMPKAKQTEFDAGVLFHFNTGAIKRATWVKNWRAKAPAPLLRAGLKQWVKGGGKVLPGLVARREREADLLILGLYAGSTTQRVAATVASSDAKWVVPMTITERASVKAQLHGLGYGSSPVGDEVSAAAIRQFQRDNDLTVDGVIGRATLSTLQRCIDARAKAIPAVAAPLAASAAPATGAGEVINLPAYADWIALGLGTAYALWIAFQYRDVIAAHVHPRLPRLAALLRSF